MRRWSVVALVLVAACSSTQELAETTTSTTTQTSTTQPTPSSTPPAPTSTTSTTPVTTTTLPELQGLAYESVAEMGFPIQLVPRNANESLIATKDGRVWSFDGNEVRSEPVLDINERVRNDGEQGLLSLTVHPDDDSRLFIHFTANDGDTLVEEFEILESGVVAQEPVQELFRLNQPARNHNGGMIQMVGSDLYIGLGDGGSSNDRFNNGQDRSTLLGGLVRIDVDAPNPELFHYGLRNPWRFWIDGDLVYVADVGQNTFEEITVAPLEADVNHGWPITEGLHCFRPSSGCDTAGITLPEVEVRHGDAGTCSITGGVVYRGTAIPEIQGHFFYSDFCGGYLRSFLFVDGEVVEEVDWTDQVGGVGSVGSFGVDHNGEMYVVTTGEVLRVVPER